MNVPLSVVSLILGTTAAFGQADMLCQTLLGQQANNGLYAVLEDNQIQRLSSCESRRCTTDERQSSVNPVSYRQLQYFLYVYSDESRFHPVGPGHDVVVARLQTVDGENSARQVVVTRREFPLDCENERNLFSYEGGKELVDLNVYVDHHRAQMATRSRELRYRFHFMVRADDSGGACVWTDDESLGDRVSQMFSFEDVDRLSRIADTIGHTLVPTGRAWAAPEEDPAALRTRYAGLDAQLIYVDEVEDGQKGCFMIDKPLPSYMSSFGLFFGFSANIATAESEASSWHPRSSALFIERWSAAPAGADERAATLDYIISWEQ